MNYDKEKYLIWKLPHPLLIHWIINPGLAFNELILGQRMPCVMLIDKTSDAPLMEKTYIPCEACNALNDGRLWSKGNSFGHWFGYICPVCGAKIKCLWNITSFVVLVASFPIWIWLKLFLEKHWIEKEKIRLTKVNPAEFPTAKSTSWIRLGLLFGGLMFVAMNVNKFLHNTMHITELLIQIIIWMLAGLLFGFSMKFFLGRKKTK